MKKVFVLIEQDSKLKILRVSVYTDEELAGKLLDASKAAFSTLHVTAVR